MWHPVLCIHSLISSGQEHNDIWPEGVATTPLFCIPICGARPLSPPKWISLLQTAQRKCDISSPFTSKSYRLTLGHIFLYSTLSKAFVDTYYKGMRIKMVQVSAVSILTFMKTPSMSLKKHFKLIYH